MLHEFLTLHRENLIKRCQAKVAQRSSPKTTKAELDHGIALFLDQLIKTLKVEQSAQPMLSRKISGASGGVSPEFSEMGKSAALHGGDLLKRGFTVEQVVHDYGDLCQSITDLCVELDTTMDSDEFRTLNRCLDNAIANAVTEYNYRRDFHIADKHVKALNVQLGVFAHELRNLVNTATLALGAIRMGNVGLSGATGAVLDRSLVGLRNLIDRSLTDVRVAAGMPIKHKLFSLAEFIAEVKVSSALEAHVRECTFVVSDVDPDLAVSADRDLLLSATGNLLQNAFKFTHAHTEVVLNAYAAADRIMIDVKDNCGGLPTAFAEHLFVPFTQEAEDKSGLGLGLSIARRSVEANDGRLSVRNVPGFGCVFTIDLPRYQINEEPVLAAEAPLTT